MVLLVVAFVATSNADIRCKENYKIPFGAYCTRYLLCKNGAYIPQRCPRNMIFNKSELKCVFAGVYECVNGFKNYGFVDDLERSKGNVVNNEDCSYEETDDDNNQTSTQTPKPVTTPSTVAAPNGTTAAPAPTTVAPTPTTAKTTVATTAATTKPKMLVTQPITPLKSINPSI